MKKSMFTTAGAIVAAGAILSLGAPAVADDAAMDPAKTALEQVTADLARSTKAHPRLFATAEEFAALRDLAAKDENLKLAVTRLRREADAACKAKPLVHKLTGFRLLGTARDCLKRTLNCSMMFKLTGEEKYKAGAMKSVNEVLAFPDWNPKHFLDVAEFSLAVAIAYDWLYEALDEDERARIETGLVKLGIDPSFTGKNWWIGGKSNWTSVCHAGEMAAAFALKDLQPELAAKVIHRGVVNLKRPAAVLAPNGNYPEGPGGYWQYGVGFHLLAVDMLEKILGTSYGLADVKGWKETAEYPDLLTGPTGKFFNYSDGGMNRSPDQAPWWFARRYDRPDILVSNELNLFRRAISAKGGYIDRLFALTLLWYRPVPAGLVSKAPLAWQSDGVSPLATQRSGWGKDDFFVAIKAGTPSENHGHMDGGSFVMDAGGVRWAYDIGAEGYHRIESRGMKLWSSAQNADRWKVYRLNNFSHNTLVIDGELQLAKGFAKVVSLTPGADSKAVLDLSPLYPNAREVVRTGEMGVDGRSYVLRDQVKGAKPGVPVRWAMMTRAKVTKKDGGRLVLDESGCTMELSQMGGEWEWEVEENPHPNEWDSENRDYRQIRFTVPTSASGDAEFGVKFRLTSLAGAAGAFKPGVKMSGFAVKSVTELPEVKGRLVRMEHEKSGAELAWLDRDDDNKTFAIGFRTLPDDDTGVPHIIEHSVLCGSEKYPVKEPFVDLLKSSFATFLNAFTSSDATMYPVCSRNFKDFMNLVDVYMDAVLHPLSVKSPLAFRQEGWHYELDKPDGELKRNGVVYSEMKGVFSDPERRLRHEMNRLLYPNTCYGKVSGGDPAAIPTLTFEKYKAFYERFYHPSNARIFLDGKMDVPKVLVKLDGFLAPYERREIDAPVKFQWPVSAARKLEYGVGAGEKTEGKTFVATGWVCGRFDEREKCLALDILSDVLAGDNEAPLKKALLDAGLCEDVRFSVESSAQIQAQVVVKGVKAGNDDAVRTLVRDTLARLADEGLNHERIVAILDRAEFHDREKDYGSFPRGLAFYMGAVDLWHYGGDPADAFRRASLFASLREKIPAGFFEALLKKCFVENTHRADLTMNPSATLAAANREAEKKELAKIKAGWTKEELDTTLAECRALEKHQSEPDRPEDIAKLPTLAVADVPLKGPVTAREVVDVDGVTVIRPHTQANGVFHAVLYFDASDFTAEELIDLPSLARVLGDLPTGRHPIVELRNALDGKLGMFGGYAEVFSQAKDGGAARPCMVVCVSALESRSADALALVPEVLRETLFTDVKAIGNLLRQKRIAAERSANGIGGRNFAARRAAAQLSSRGAIDELFNGIAQIRHLQSLEKRFAEDGAAYAERLAGLAAKLFTRDRLVVALSDNIGLDWAKRIAEAFPLGSVGAPVSIAPFSRRKEGFRTLGKISGAALVAHPAKSPYDGRAAVAGHILSLGYLWDEIRVKGGAYGGGFRVSPNGDARWLSWNDPKPARSFGVYAECGKVLKAFAEGNEPLDRYIIGAVADTEPYLTPRVETERAAELWLSGRTPDDQQRLRAEMLRTTKDDLKAFAKAVDAFAADAAVCVVGGPQPLESCTNVLESVEALVQ